jgi:hypothetical protein
MIKLSKLLTETTFTLGLKDDWEYKYDMKNTGTPWWTRRKGTDKWIDMKSKLTPEKYKEAVEKLRTAIKSKTYIKTTDTDTATDSANVIKDTTIKRNKNGWIIPNIKTDINIIDKESSRESFESFVKLQNSALAALKQQLVGKQIRSRFTDKYIYAFSGDDTDWAQYDLNAFSSTGWPLNASGTANIRPILLNGQTIGDVYVLISFNSKLTTNGMEFKTKFECSVVWVGGKINAWIPTSSIDVIQ